MNRPTCTLHTFGVLILFGVAITSAPALPQERQATMVAQDFFNYLVDWGTDIGGDVSSQKKWLASSLRDYIAEVTHSVVLARKMPDVNGPDPAIPDNGTFLNVWDIPSSCRVFGGEGSSQRYLVEVACHWGSETDHPGMERNFRIYYMREGRAWMVYEIDFFDDHGKWNGGLLNNLRNVKLEAISILGE